MTKKATEKETKSEINLGYKHPVKIFDFEIIQQSFVNDFPEEVRIGYKLITGVNQEETLFHIGFVICILSADSEEILASLRLCVMAEKPDENFSNEEVIVHALSGLYGAARGIIFQGTFGKVLLPLIYPAKLYNFIAQEKNVEKAEVSNPCPEAENPAGSV